MLPRLQGKGIGREIELVCIEQAEETIVDLFGCAVDYFY